MTARTPRHTTPRRTPMLVAATMLAAAPALAQAPILVTSTADRGDGTLRAALSAAAEAAGPARIVVVTAGGIAIESTLEYAGTAPLEIHGTGQTVSTAANATLLAVTSGADLTVDGLNFAGPGGFSIEARGDRDGPAGKGIFVDVGGDRDGVVTLVLNDVAVSGVANHGIHVSDCDLADACGAGGGGAGGGSPASIVVHLGGVSVRDVGNGKFDADGLRVDERAAGGIRLIVQDSLFAGVGADGIELDEGQDGDVSVLARDVVLRDNGGYCAPSILEAFMPEAAEAEFGPGEMAEADVPAAVTGSPDDACFEREVSLYDDGSVEEYEFAIDVDDAFDVDEAGPGGIDTLMIGGAITGSLDEGLDYDEEGPGGVALTVVGTAATDNADDAFKVSEEDAGDVVGLAHGVTATGNGGVGFVFEEADGGDVTVTLTGVTSAGNDEGELGVVVVQEDAGAGRVSIEGSDIADGVEAEGAEVTGL